MVLEEIDAQLAALRQRNHQVVRIRIGEDVLPRFIAELASTGTRLPMDGSPVTYRDVPVEVGAIDTTSVVVESEPA